MIFICKYSLSVELQLPKLVRRVRLPPSAYVKKEEILLYR